MVYGLKKISITGYRIISADETKNNIIKNVIIFNLDENYSLIEKFIQKKLIYQKINGI